MIVHESSGTSMSQSQQDHSAAATVAELLEVVSPHVERIEDGFKAIRVTLDALAEHLRAGQSTPPPSPATKEARAEPEQAETGAPPVPEAAAETPPEPPPMAVGVPVSAAPPVAEPVRPAQPAAPRAEPGPASIAVTGSGGGNWSQIVFGDQLRAIAGVSHLSGSLLADVYEGDNDALGLLGQVLTFRSATAERKPKLLKDLGEAFYLWKPRGDPELRDPLIAWLHVLLDQADIPNRVEIVQAGDRFDLQRHTSRERGVEVGEVYGWVVLRENGKVYSKANVSAK
jgi:hypothetical protein